MVLSLLDIEKLALILTPMCCLGRSSDSNSGAATPTSIYRMYSKGGAVAANPYTLRAIRKQTAGLTFSTLGKMPCTTNEKKPMLAFAHPVTGGSARRSDSPPRASFKVLNAGAFGGGSGATGGGALTLTLKSLR